MGPVFVSQRVLNLHPAHVVWVLESLNMFLEALSQGEATCSELNRSDTLAGITAHSKYQGRYELTDTGETLCLRCMLLHRPVF
jgi:hypothetical protein